MSESGKAVFLSYASQDAGAARRICEALRVAGLEVWFDQNELRGGDAWDQKIRRQIKECALFVPVISANTQARQEGYFRLEWKLAVDRSYLMADDAPFIVPVVIDDTPESAARVPDRFREVQWTRLVMTETATAFAERMRMLVMTEKDSDVSAGSSKHRQPVRQAQGPEPVVADARAAPRASGRGHGWRWWMIFPIGGMLIALAGALRPYVAPDRSRAIKSESLAKAPPAPVSEARQLVVKAHALYEPWDGATREDFALAEQLVKRAIALDATDGDAWAAYGVISCALIVFGHDRSPERREIARTAAERAVRLAPDSNQARFAQAFYYRFQDTTRAEAERLLRELVERAPTDKLVVRTLGSLLRNAGRTDEALAFYDRAAALPGSDPVALYNKFLTLMNAKRFAEAEAAIDQSLALKPTGYAYRAKATLLLQLHGDLDGAAATLAKVPAAFLLEDAGAFFASQVWLWRREPEKALSVLGAVPRDLLENDFGGPTAFLRGQAHQIAGRREAARTEWSAALRVVEQQLATQLNSTRWIYWRARLLACLEQTAEAERVLRTFEELTRSPGVTDGTIPIYLLLGRRADVLTGLEARSEQIFSEGNAGGVALVLNNLRYDPAWDPLRGDARFEALQRRFQEKRAALREAAK